MKTLKICAVVCLMMVMCGCADYFNKAKFQGGMFGVSTKGDYIIVSQSGGKIMDVWKLKDVFVSSPDNSDGWVFNNGQSSLAIGGDAKIIRVRGGDVWEKYHEYHMEFSGKTYRELYNSPKN